MSDDRFTTVLAAAREGSEPAWSEIYRELAGPLLGYLRSSGAAEPDDALGEVFLQAARDLGSFEGDWSQFRSWVFTIAHHRVIDAGRRRARRPMELAAEPPHPPGPPDPDAAEEALARVGDEEVWQVLEELSADQRAVLLLRVIGGLTAQEAADALGKRVGAVKQLQRRGLAAVQREFAKRGVTL